MAYRKTDHSGVTVYKRSNGVWYARWRDPDTDEIQYRSLREEGFTTKTQAAEWLRSKSKELKQERQRVNQGRKAPGVGEEWSTIEEEYLDHFEAEHGKKAAERTERDWLRRWKEFRVDYHILRGADLSARALGQFRDSLGKVQSKLAPSTRNRTLGTVRAMMNWAKTNRFIRLNGDEIRDALKPFRERQSQPRIFSKDELVSILDAVVEHDTARFIASRANKRNYSRKNRQPKGEQRYEPIAPFILIALLTGMRPGEVAALKWDDVDTKHKEIHVWGSKTQRERIVPLHDSPLLLKLFERLQKDKGTDIHVCGDWDGGKPIELNHRRWKRIKDKTKLKNMPVKALRSTCVAHVASASPDSEYLLEARFGHGARVSKKHYRRPLHGLRKRGRTVEEWLGVNDKLTEMMTKLDLI